MVGLDIAEDYLRRGYSIAVSPEGTRTLLQLEERVIHSGPAELALRTGFPVVPVKLDGFGEVMPKGMNFPQPLDGLQRKPVSVRIGEAMVFDVENMSVGSRSQQRGLITAALRERLLEM